MIFIAAIAEMGMGQTCNAFQVPNDISTANPPAIDFTVGVSGFLDVDHSDAL